MLTTFDLDEHVYDAFRAGASGFLLKNVSPEDLIAAVRAVAAGDALLAPAITRRLVERFVTAPRPADAPALVSLSEREREVLTLISQARSNAEIGRALFIRPRHGEDPRRPGPRQTRAPRPHPGRRLRYESGLVNPGTAAQDES